MATRDEGRSVGKAEGTKAQASDLLTFLPSYLLFFLLCFLYLWLVVEPRLIYYCFGTILPDAPDFATGGSFLRDSLGVPGGPVMYVAGLLSQGFYYGWLGAGIIVLAGFCLSELTRRHLAFARFAWASVVATFPAIIFFLIYNQYNHPLTTGLAVSLGLLLSLALERLSVRRPLLRVAVYSFVAVVGSWLGGGGTLLVFALMTVAHALGRVCTAHRLASNETAAGVRCTPYELLALPVALVVVWVLARHVYLIRARDALLTLTPLAPLATTGMGPFLKVMVFLLYGFVPLAVLLVSVGNSLFSGRTPKPAIHPKKTKRRDKDVATRRRRLSIAPIVKPALSAVPIVLMAVGLYVTHKELRKAYVLSNYYACQKSWDRILDLGARLPKGKSNAYVSHDIIRALYHKGRLPYDMFRYPLIPEAILLTHEDRQSDLTQWKLSDIFLELGYVNMAQKLASEVLSTKGHLGIALEQLAWISIIKGQPDTARVYLNALKKDPIHHGRAASLLRGLDGGFTPEQVAYIDAIRSRMQDDIIAISGTEPIDETLAALLKHDPRNKMAFEYLMACYLLTGQVDKIAANIDRLRDLGYSKIPTLYEEAILIHYGSAGGQMDLAKFPISRETLQRYEVFARLSNAMETPDRQAVLNRLIRDFGTSYFFYFTFGRVGLI